MTLGKSEESSTLTSGRTEKSTGRNSARQLDVLPNHCVKDFHVAHASALHAAEKRRRREDAARGSCVRPIKAPERAEDLPDTRSIVWQLVTVQRQEVRLEVNFFNGGERVQRQNAERGGQSIMI